MAREAFRLDMYEVVGAEGTAWSLTTDGVSLYLLRGEHDEVERTGA